MSSPATVSEYGKFIDLQAYNLTAPAKSGSIYLSGAAGSELVRTNVGLSAAGNVTAVGSFIIGSADMDETDLEKLDGITNGTVAANKAVVVDANKDASGFRNVTAEGSFIIGSADLNETDLEKLDGITNGTAAANKAVVLDGSKNIATLGTVGCGAITSTGASTLGSLGVGAVSSSATLHAVGAATFSKTVAASGSITAGSSFIIGSADLNETDLEKLDGITNGTAAANKALVLDANKAIGTITHLTATYAQIDVLDVNEINSVTRTETTLEVVDKLILAASGSASAAAAGGGLQIGGTGGSDTVASVLYDHANTALDFNIGGTTEVRLQDGVFRPETDNDVDLGASGAEFKDLYLDGVAYVDELRADQLGAALDANDQAITNINVDSGAIDGTVIGANSAAAGTFAALVGTSLSVSDGNITNVGDVALDSISADGADIDLNLPDNQAAALDIKEGSTSYMKFVTTNGQEYIQVGKQASFAMGASIEDDQVLALGSNGTESHLKYISADNILEMSGTANGLRFSGSADFGQYGIQAGTVAFGAATVTSLSVRDGNITNVGDIALDSISADGNDIDIVMTDNRETALEIKEGSNVYLQFDTSNGYEAIFAKKEFEFQAGANVDDDQKFKFATDESDTGASGSLAYISSHDVFEISGSASRGLSFSGSANFNSYGIEAGEASFAATTVTSLSVSDGNITNVGDINCDSVSVDDAAVGLDIVFGGNTGLNNITLSNNLADALSVKDGTGDYLKFVSTTGQQGLEVGKEAEFLEGLLVRDDKTLTFGDDDDGSIQFVSAANVVRFDGGSSGLHFNDDSAFGSDGGGKDVSFHGATANELMKYTAADHTLTFVGSGGGSAFLTLGGDATSEFAVDVAEGSNNQNKIRASAFVTYSDERLKTDVAPMENGLETVNNLKAVNFTWKKDGTRDFGFMAQQLKQVVPQAVHGSEETMLGVDYGRLSAILVSAIQEQSAQIASLKKQLENK